MALLVAPVQAPPLTESRDTSGSAPASIAAAPQGWLGRGAGSREPRAWSPAGDWSIAWSADCLVDGLADGLVDWLVDGLLDCLVGLVPTIKVYQSHLGITSMLPRVSIPKWHAVHTTLHSFGHTDASTGVHITLVTTCNHCSPCFPASERDLSMVQISMMFCARERFCFGPLTKAFSNVPLHSSTNKRKGYCSNCGVCPSRNASSVWWATLSECKLWSADVGAYFDTINSYWYVILRS